jgi:hypothetical protein
MAAYTPLFAGGEAGNQVNIEYVKKVKELLTKVGLTLLETRHWYLC